MNAKKENTDEKAEKSGSFWKELPLLIVIALVLAFVIRTWVAQPFYIPSGSMENTLLVGDRVLVNKLVYQVREIQRGDVIVFNGGGSWDEGPSPVPVEESGNIVGQGFSWVAEQFGAAPSGRDYIKRVIGVPGDTVECCDAQNRVLVNDEPLNEPYLYPGSIETHLEFGPVTVPEGRLWLMGDHRISSKDSRRHQNEPGGGSVPIDHVVGRASLVVWPVDRWSTLPTPETFEELEEGGSKQAGGDGGEASGTGGAAGAPAGSVEASAALPFVLGAAGAVPVREAGRRALAKARGGRARGPAARGACGRMRRTRSGRLTRGA
ncbi:signal peptidase I [Streptomonospora litoralis]|uniref:Signal peptidase I n=1 Tax=Streptomonospora litoralis TaxID=2498135 RepID=A0A4P6Q4N9_9ACTN|nr:signal peptidase I [Streptomonospora litoralis]QBI55668.1 Signal peptidase I [Streptomonospora litoralis]